MQVDFFRLSERQRTELIEANFARARMERSRTISAMLMSVWGRCVRSHPGKVRPAFATDVSA